MLKYSFITPFILCSLFFTLTSGCSDENGKATEACYDISFNDTLDIENQWNCGLSGSIVIADDGNIYMTDFHRDRFLVYSMTGDLIDIWNIENDSEIMSPIYLDYKNGIFYSVCWCGYESRIVEFDCNRQIVKSWPERYSRNSFSSYLDAIAVGDDGSVYTLTQRGLIVKYNNNGDYDLEWQLQFGSANGITLGIDNNVYISEVNHNQVTIYSCWGDFLDILGGDDFIFDHPTGMITNECDNICVCEFGRNRMAIFNTNGTFRGYVNFFLVNEGPRCIAIKDEFINVTYDDGIVRQYVTE